MSLIFKPVKHVRKMNKRKERKDFGKIQEISVFFYSFRGIEFYTNKKCFPLFPCAYTYLYFPELCWLGAEFPQVLYEG
jgi:hypothetical protein